MFRLGVLVVERERRRKSLRDAGDAGAVDHLGGTGALAVMMRTER
jgi:hypothetical protein